MVHFSKNVSGPPSPAYQVAPFGDAPKLVTEAAGSQARPFASPPSLEGTIPLWVFGTLHRTAGFGFSKNSVSA